MALNCPQCGNENPDSAGFCDNCGASLSGAAPAQPQQPAAPAAPAQGAPAGGATCPQCGASVIPGEAFCDNCGADLSSVQPGGQPPPQQQQPQQQQAPPAQPAPQQPAQAPAGGGVTCPTCGSSQPAGQAFCDNCGAQLSGAPPSGPPPSVPPPVQPSVQPVGRPRLVVAGTGVEIDLSGKAEAAIGREDPVSGVFPEVDLTPHGGEEGGVSREHAKLTFQGNQWQVQDLNSTNFTFVNNQKLNPGMPQPLNDGDQVRLGKVVLTFHTS